MTVGASDDATWRALRRAAVDHTLFSTTSSSDAIERLGFVQADPIRAPARAQDLILRQRVDGYRAGDLERAYPALPVFEDMIHVYGFAHERLRRFLHPRRIARTFRVETEHPHLRRAILAHLERAGPSHPRAIEQAVASRHGRTSIVNAWGGQSNATTRMLDLLHYRGVLSVVRRERGIRVYALAEAVAREAPTLSPVRRAEGLIELLVDLYAPLPMASLNHLTYLLGERTIARDALRDRVPKLLARGILVHGRLDGIDWVRPATATLAPQPESPRVRFLAPFDPLVWDRRRFTALWQWTYRFEAYTPLAKRTLGYYALPLLWDTGDDATVVGWVNASNRASDGARRLDIAPGFIDHRPSDPAFERAYDAEVERLRRFLSHDSPEAFDEPA